MMASTLVKYGAALSLLLAVLVALLRRLDLGQEQDLGRSRLDAVLRGLERVERDNALRLRPKVALGYGACQDLFVDAGLLLPYDALADRPQHFSDIRSREEFLQSYAFFFRHGAAAERYVSNHSLFQELLEAAATLEGARYAVGGNAPIMASRFHAEGCEVLLAARMSRELRSSLHQDIAVVGGDVRKDDIHLILEYKAGESWGIYSSPRANRFIVHNDANNPMVTSLEVFDKALDDFEPDLLVVSGLQMMDNYPFQPGQRLARLAKVRGQMMRRAPSTRIHFEMASFSDADLLREITTHIIPFADSLGMNEQELVNLQSVLQFGNVSAVSDSNPRVATALDQMREVFGLVLELSSAVPEGRRLTRLHVHTLAYQAVMTGGGSPWKTGMAAAAKASLTAHRHVCATARVDPGRARLLMDESFSTSAAPGGRRVPLDAEDPVACWEEEAVQICVAPVLVCTRAHQTAGGGDNISSAGLVLQI